VTKLLAENNALATRRASNDKTPLHWAAEKNQREIAELLIAAGADIEMQTSWGANRARMGRDARQQGVDACAGAWRARLNLWTAAGLGMFDVARRTSKMDHPDPTRDAGPRKGDEAAKHPAGLGGP